MKNSIKLAVFVLAVSLFSCHKDQIEVVKNLDTSWSVDQKVLDDDIRSRLGYDPRFNYVLTETTELDFPMLSLGDLPISGENTQQIEVKLLEPTQKDLNVTLQYTPELFEKVKKDLSGYELGAENLIKIAQTQKVIQKGQKSVVFDIVVTNDPKFKDRKVVPFTFKTDDESIKLLENKDRILVKVFNQEITYTYPTRIVRNVMLGENSSMYSNKFSFSVEASKSISDALTLSVQRADLSGLPNIAPDGTEGVLPAPQSFQNSVLGGFSFDLSIEGIEKEIYQLPLQIVATIGNQSYTLPNTISIVVDATADEEANVFIDTKIMGSPIPKTDIDIPEGIRDFGIRGKINVWTDGRHTFFKDIPEGEGFTASFKEMKTITSIKISNQSWGDSLEGGEFYAENEKGQEVFLGSFSVSSERRTQLIVNFKVPVKTKKIKYKNAPNFSPISEIDIYEE